MGMTPTLSREMARFTGSGHSAASIRDLLRSSNRGCLPRHRRAVFEALRQRGIGVNVHYIPVHTQPYYRAMGFAEGDFPQAERYYREAISLPLYPTMSDAQQNTVVEALRESLADPTRSMQTLPPGAAA
jgi:dTDP-4-amino-4,6-dideoxygalactose transaminase